tara:strand:+ start:106 stop:381 length:276 start_codon:yes stop_codon:yes gene_type:complete
MIVCEHNSCLKELNVADFKRRDVYPCCGKPLGQTIQWPAPTPPTLDLGMIEEPIHQEPPVRLPVEEPPVEEPVVAKAPAKKKAPKAKKAKK